MIIFFNDYKTYHLLKYEAVIKNIPLSEAINNALINYIQKVSSVSIDKLPKGKMKAWMVIKAEADKNNCTVAEFIERAIIEYCGINTPPKLIETKRSSWLDLNRDAKR